MQLRQVAAGMVCPPAYTEEVGWKQKDGDVVTCYDRDRAAVLFQEFPPCSPAMQLIVLLMMV